jgi:hypothetical protein
MAAIGSTAIFADSKQLRSAGMNQRRSAQDLLPVPQSLYVGELVALLRLVIDDWYYPPP